MALNARRPARLSRRVGRAVGWPSGLRRQFQALVSSEAWVRIPLQSRFCYFFVALLVVVGVVRLLVGRLGAENGVWVETDNKHTNNNDSNKKLPRLGIAPRLPRPQRGVLLLYYLGDHAAPRFARNQQT